ncbi:right-handed parallel beta-helix repeat-containing protein [Planctomycetes bacterium Poly30]|uniref:right-handed parallel beta-helix repeat-containing protein n=1 Tax=Saltatorellus ferox TaxID=2528018 RepID=UPI0011A1FB8F
MFSADSFGATPDQPDDDDGPAIQAAIDAAIDYSNLSGEAATVLLTGGAEYRLKTGRRGRGYLDLSCHFGAGPVVFDGAGATLIVETPRLGVFYIDRSERVRIQDVVIDLDPLPHIACRVTAVHRNARTVIAQPFPGATDLAQFPGYSDEWGWIHDPDVLHRPKRGVASSFAVTERTQQEPGGPIRFTMTPQVDLGDFAVGDVLSFLYRRGNNFRIQYSSGIELRRVISYGAGLFFVATTHDVGLTVRDCAVLVKPGRVQATGGDGVHLKYCRDVSIENCYFEGLSDDGVNVSATIGFRVEGCEFHSKRRQAVVLDTDQVAYRSRNGVLRDNTATFNGNSFLYHDGGDYRSVLVAGTKVHGNNRSTSVEQSFTGRLVEQGTVAIGGEKASLAWSADGDVGVRSELFGAAGAHHWRLIRIATERGQRWRLEAFRPGGPQPWLYLTYLQHLSVEPSRLGGPRDDPERATIDAQVWIQERVGEATVRLLHEASGLYLATKAEPSGGALGMTADVREASVWTLLLD